MSIRLSHYASTPTPATRNFVSKSCHEHYIGKNRRRAHVVFIICAFRARSSRRIEPCIYRILFLFAAARFVPVRFCLAEHQSHPCSCRARSCATGQCFVRHSAGDFSCFHDLLTWFSEIYFGGRTRLIGEAGFYVQRMPNRATFCHSPSMFGRHRLEHVNKSCHIHKFHLQLQYVYMLDWFLISSCSGRHHTMPRVCLFQFTGG